MLKLILFLCAFHLSYVCAPLLAQVDPPADPEEGVVTAQTEAMIAFYPAPFGDYERINTEQIQAAGTITALDSDALVPAAISDLNVVYLHKGLTIFNQLLQPYGASTTSAATAVDYMELTPTRIFFHNQNPADLTDFATAGIYVQNAMYGIVFDDANAAMAIRSTEDIYLQPGYAGAVDTWTFVDNANNTANTFVQGVAETRSLILSNSSDGTYPDETTWAIYRGSDANRPDISPLLSDGGTTTPSDYAVFGEDALRFRTPNSGTNGVIYENASDVTLFSVRADDGATYVAGDLNAHNGKIKVDGNDAVPAGLIIAYAGGFSVPEGWLLCDGTNGTPDLRSLFVKGASVVATTATFGGSNTHTHPHDPSSVTFDLEHDHAPFWATVYGHSTSTWNADHWERLLQYGELVSAMHYHYLSSVSALIDVPNFTGSTTMDLPEEPTGTGSSVPENIKLAYLMKA